MENVSRFVKLSASAGSGKTYQLSRRFVNLLGNLGFESNQNFSDHCGSGVDPDKDYNISSILAITFTNKAAAEMKERILLNLKEIALEKRQLEGFGIDPDDAFRALLRITEHFSDFNVKTIDSFMNTILKAFAVEAERLPDYELNFEGDYIFDMVLDRLFDDSSGKIELLTDFLVHILKTTTYPGFNPENMIRNRLKKMRKSEQNINHELIQMIQVFDCEKEREALFRKYLNFHQELINIHETLNCLKGNLFKVDSVRKSLESREIPNWVYSKNKLSDLLKKGNTFDSLQQMERTFEEMKSDLKDYTLKEAIEQVRNTIVVYSHVSTMESQYLKEHNVFDGSTLPDTVRDLLAGDNAVPAAFCRLGERYVHYLIDEFQDTSRRQWVGIKPLVENSLAEGGSLFYVGDVKQAIYGWRGGDYSLFSEVENELNTDSHSPEVSLKTNFRSRQHVVEFNNTVFNPSHIHSALSSMKDLDPILINNLGSIYSGSFQDSRSEGGYVKGKLFYEDSSEDSLESLKEFFYQILEDVRTRYQDGEILILARSNSEISTVASWIMELDTSIPFVTESSLKLFSNSCVKSLLNFMVFASRPFDSYILQGLLAGGFLDSSFGELVPEALSEFSERKNLKENRKFSFVEFLEADKYRLLTDFLRSYIDAAEILTPYEFCLKVIGDMELRTNEHTAYIDRFLELILSLENKGLTGYSQLTEALYEKLEKVSLTMPENTESIRIMTIHKAKGLEAPVVCVPFLNWRMSSGKYDDIVELEENTGQYVPLKKEMAELSLRVSNILQDKKIHEFSESFNMMYVALTRARDELYVSATRKGKYVSIADVFIELLLNAGLISDKTCLEFECGKKTAMVISSATEEQCVPDTVSRLSENFRNWLMPESEDSLTLDFENRLYGTVIHDAMSQVKILSDECGTVEQLAEKALITSLNIHGLHWDDIIKQTAIKVISRGLNTLRPWFEGVDKVFIEKELISGNGRIVRLDRLVEKDGRYMVLEFKAGKQMDHYVDQVRNYMRIVKASVLDEEVLGLIYYFETDELISVYELEDRRS